MFNDVATRPIRSPYNGLTQLSACAWRCGGDATRSNRRRKGEGEQNRGWWM